MAIGRNGAFTEKDNHIFKVWPRSDMWKENQGLELMARHMVGDNIEDARLRAHRFVDTMFDKWREYEPSPPPAPAVVVQTPQDCDSLNIGGVVGGEKPPASVVVQDNLLNLKDLL